MAFRFLLVSITGDVTGTNDAGEAADFADSDDINVMIDTELGIFSNEDEADQPIAEHDGTDDSDDGDDD